MHVSEVLTPRRDGRRSPPSATFASARPPCRLSVRHVFPDSICGSRNVYPQTHFCGTKASTAQIKAVVLKQSHHFRPTRRGCFFPAKAQKKSTPDGSAKRVFKLREQQCQYFRMGRPSEWIDDMAVGPTRALRLCRGERRPSRRGVSTSNNHEQVNQRPSVSSNYERRNAH